MVLLKIPPPLFYVAAFFLGLLIDRFVPASIDLGRSAIPTIAAGALLVVGIVMGPLNAIRFLVRKTTLNPNKEATVFLTKGMYAFSRNPMYLGLFFMYVAIAIFNAKVWPLATMVIPFVLLDRIVIPFEERVMEERYGAEYRDYCSRVGRWITLGRR